MIQNCTQVSQNIAQLDVLNENTIAEAVQDFEDTNLNRFVVTDAYGIAIYDSETKNSTVDKVVSFPEVPVALEGNDVFNWTYRSGVMRSSAASPVYSYGMLIGCVYMMENDAVQGALIASLQNNILIITLVLELFVILFSLFSSSGYTRRLLKISNSIRTVRQGDYSQKIELHGHDELKNLSDEFNDLIHRLQVSENKRNQFVSDASHELKTPLASIKLLSDSILQNEMDTETMKEFVSDIGNEAERLNRMSQKLLKLSGSDATDESVEYTITSIAETITNVARMLSAMAEENKINIHLDIDQDTTILTSEDDLYHIIFNLMENGIKYNKPGGSLTVVLRRQNNDAVLRVTDTGVGIPSDSLSHIFERFYRVDKARSRSTGGSGLGLSIVRNMVERNNGTIQVESAVGEGTAFVLTFPIFDM